MAQDEDGTIPTPRTQAVVDQTVKVDFAGAPTISATRPVGPIDFPLDESGAGQPSQSGNHVALPRGYVMQEYTIEAVLGVGGFGITYLAQDNNLQRRVAIKEYLPNDLAIRAAGQTVIPRSDTDANEYRVGLDRFLAEARVLATFHHSNIVRVSRFFEANQTAYMVMDYERGESLRSWVENHGPADEAMVLKKFLPLLEGLETVHHAGVVHRDIKPANIYVRDVDGSLVLLDFGAARQTKGASSKSLTSIITPGYAPFEQYHTRGSQGPWTDIYALGGVLYWLVTGQKPIEAPSRIKDDPLLPAIAAGAGRFSDAFLRAIDWALTVDEGRRPHSVAEFRNALTGTSPVPAHRETVGAVTPPRVPSPPAAKRAGGIKYALAGGGIALVAALVFVAMKPGDKPGQPSSAANVAGGEATSAKGSAQVAQKDAARKGQSSSTVGSSKKSVTTDGVKSAGGPTAVLSFEIVPPGESVELIIDKRAVGRVSQMKEYRLPAGKHKVELHGNKRPYVYLYWVDLGPNEKKKLWARFTDE